MSTTRKRAADDDDDDDFVKKTSSSPSAAAAAAAVAVANKHRDKAEKFVSKIAEFLREAVNENEDWNDDTVKNAFEESVEALPNKSKVRKKIKADLELYKELLVQRVFRENECKPLEEIDSELYKLKKEIEDPDNAWFAMTQKIPKDWSTLNLAELLIQADYAMKRMSFDIPSYIWRECGAEAKDIALAEVKRIESMKTSIDCVERCVKYFITNTTASNVSKDDARGLSEILGKITSIASLRRAAGCVLQCPAELQRYISRLVFFKYAFRKHARKIFLPSSTKEQRRDRDITAMHDGAILCGNYRGDLIHYLAECIASKSAISLKKNDGDDVNNIMFSTSKFVLDLLPNIIDEDDEIFEAALGMGGFSEEWEKQAKRAIGLKLNSTTTTTTTNSEDFSKTASSKSGPQLVRRPMLQQWNYENQNFEDVPSNFSEEVKLSMSSLDLNKDDDILDDDDLPMSDPDMMIDESKFYEEEQLEVPREEIKISDEEKKKKDIGDENDTASGTIGEVRAYFDFMRVLRRYINMLRAKRTSVGRLKADTLMRCTGSTPAPTLLLAKLPEGMIRAIDPSSASVELSAVSEEAFEAIFVAWISAKKFLTTAHLNPEKATNDDLFFFDGNNDEGAAAAVAEFQRAMMMDSSNQAPKDLNAASRTAALAAAVGANKNADITKVVNNDNEEKEEEEEGEPEFDPDVEKEFLDFLDELAGDDDVSAEEEDGEESDGDFEKE
jgi:hypothetical protein